MSFKSIEEAEAYIQEHGEDATRQALAEGRFGSDIRTFSVLHEVFARRERIAARNLQDEALQASVRSANASEKAALAASTSARWTMIAAIGALIGGVVSALSVLTTEKTAAEQLAACRNLADGVFTGSAQPSRRSDYLADCMMANGFAFLGDAGEACHSSQRIVTEVKQVMPSCYVRRSSWVR